MSRQGEARGDQPRAAWLPPERPGGDGYVSAAGLARALRWMFALWIPIAAVRAAMAFGVAEQLGMTRGGRASIDSLDDIARLVAREQALAFVRAIDLLAFIAMGVVFIVWTHRVYRNLVRLGAPHRHGTGWAIGSWFTPIVSLWWPKQVLVDVWRGSAPAGEPPDERSELLGAWWSVYIASSVVGLLFANREGPGGFGAEGVAALLMLIAGILAFWVVTSVTERQEAFVQPAAHRRDGWGAPGVADVADGLRHMKWLLPVLGLVGLAIGWLLVASTGVSADEAGDTGSLRAEVADCIGFTNGPESAAWDTVNCDNAHDAEVYIAHDRDESFSAPYPGDAALNRDTVDRCETGFAAFVGSTYSESDLDYVYTVPSEATWLLGDRQEVCAVVRVDGAQLVGTAGGSGL